MAPSRFAIDGVINKLHLRTIGGALRPGEPIVDVVPHDETLLVEASIRPSDIGFLTQGQEAVLKFTAYDFAIYGGLQGMVEHISADTIEDEIDGTSGFVVVRFMPDRVGVRRKRKALACGSAQNWVSREHLPLAPEFLSSSLRWKHS